MELAELKQALYATNPAAVLVPPRILRRMLQAEFKVPHLLIQAPHEQCYFFDRQVLFRHVEQDELDLEPDRMLPPMVILLAPPTTEDLQGLDREATLLEYWRLLFHAQVHLALHRRHQEGQLTTDDIRDRIGHIGHTEFQEIRTVLLQENYLLPPEDELTIYVEFAALYLELRYFRSNLRATYFPAIQDFGAIDRLLDQDVPGDTIFNKTRLPGAPMPVVCTDTSSDESHDYYWKVLRHADRAGREGDPVRAAILRTKAARVAPVSLAQQTRAKAVADLETLTRHLQDALRFSDDEARTWVEVLPALLDKADQGNWPVEAKLLYDLQTVTLEHERKLFALDLVEWAISAGKRPIKRPLTSVQLVRTTKHLRTAAQRLAMARVSDEDRQRLAKLLQSAQQHSEDRLRERFWPILNDAFYDVGLTASSPPEQVALQKMIEELLDLITEQGFFTFADLRDTISRNQLKLPDLADPHSYWRGDPLLRLDRRLATVMEGVYRHGEFYLRWLESISSLFFGTKAGRFVTMNLAVPFGGAFVLLYMLEVFIVARFQDFFKTPALPVEVATAVGSMSSPLGQGWVLAAAALILEKTQKAISLYPTISFLPLGLFLLALMHLSPLREGIALIGRQVYRLLRLVFYEVPSWLADLPWLRALLRSWPFLLLYWYVLKPLPILALLWLHWPDTFGTLPVAIATFVGVDLLLNSRFGYAVSEALTETVVLAYGWLRFDLLQGLFNWVNFFFKQISASVEYILYSVDEWLRFRSDESRLTLIFRAVLGVVWFPIGYLIRLYFITLIEPTLNPIKLPLSSLAFKLMLIMPLYQQSLIPGTHEERLMPHVGQGMAYFLTFALIIPSLWLLPGAFAFFFWELQENWRLFRANRSRRLKPVVIGRHGEKVLQLLKRGFHSGTIPKLFAQLRKAERGAYRTGDWRSARTYRHALQEVARSVQRFVEREFIALLRQSASWHNLPIRVGQILLSCNRIRIELCHADYPQEPVQLALEERSGWLMGGLQEVGWLKHLTPEQQQVMTSALAGLYKIAGVDLVREQLASVLSPSLPGYDVSDHHLVVWTNYWNGHEILYNLRDHRDLLRPLRTNGAAIRDLPRLDARRVFFSRVPLSWDQWVECWRKDQEGKGHPRLLSDGIALLLFDGATRAETNAR